MRNRRHRVVSVLIDGMSAFEPAVADEFFGYDRSDEIGAPWYTYASCTPRPPSVRIGGFQVVEERGLDQLRRADTVVVAGAGGIRRPADPALTEALRRAHARGARMVSFCTGAFLLAEAGLLDGRPATTHWAHADEFRARFPRVRLDPAVLYVDDGDVLTSAGSAAGIDLAVHLVQRDFGADVAARVARDLVVSPHRRGGQAQFIQTPVGAPDECPDGLGTALEWAVAHLDEDLSVARLAEVALMSPRHFARRFRAVTGSTPHQWILTQRLGLARGLLETTDTSVEQIATRSGFGGAAALRLHFRRSLATSPTAYRRTFRADAPV
jgi:AraC family transcriptional regulator, transcriptional activator FtrA